jgi:hypothetical protein
MSASTVAMPIRRCCSVMPRSKVVVRGGMGVRTSWIAAALRRE